MRISCILGLVSLWSVATTAAAEPKSSDTLCVMTYNLRYASATPPNSWPERRPVARECVEKTAPDIIGTQEGVYQQLKDFHQDLPNYEWIGFGRDGGSRGEFMAVFYRKARFDPLEYDHFWLSDTPDVIGSSTWGHSNRRMVTWVRFLDRSTEKQFYLFNTHFDHRNQAAREKAALLIRDRIKALNTSLPVILTGDFNAVAGKNKTYEILVKDDFLSDTWEKAESHRGEVVNTFHGFRGKRAGEIRIDWILTQGKVKTDAVEIVTFEKDGQYPSDHFPVVAWLRLP